MKQLVVAAVLLGTLTAAQLSTNPTGSIAGTVVDADSGVLLAGMQVDASRLGRVITSEDGTYRFDKVAPGAYVVGVVSGFANIDYAPRRAVHVASDNSIRDINFRIRTMASLAGRVLDEHGQPVVGARVVALTESYSRDRNLGQRLEFGNSRLATVQEGRPATTSDTGAFEIADVRAGTEIVVMAYVPRRYATPVDHAVFEADSLARRTRVATYHPAGQSSHGAIRLVLSSLEHREHVDIQMVSAGSRCVSATLEVDGTPAAVPFLLQEAAVHDLGGYNLLSEQGRSGITGADGRIRVCDVPEGDMYVLATSQSPAINHPLVDMGVLPVPSGTRDLEDLRLNVEPSVDVPVVFERGRAAYSAEHVVPTLWTVPRTEPLGRRPAPSESQRLRLIPGMHYSLAIDGLKAPTYVADMRLYAASAATDVRREGVLVQPGDTRLEVTLATDGGDVHVTVRGTNGEPHWVLLFPTDASSDGRLATTLMAAVTTEAGEATFRGVEPGVYHALSTGDPIPSLGMLGPHTIQLHLTPRVLATVRSLRGQSTAVRVTPGAVATVSVSPVPWRTR